MQDLLVNLAEVNLNLNNKVRDGILDNFDKIKKSPTPYGDLGKLIYHLFEAINLWLNRISGTSIEITEYEKLKSQKEFFDLWVKVDQRFLTYAKDNENNLDYSKIIKYTTRRGIPESFPLRDIILHMSHHSFYHRGQIATLMRINKFKPLPEIDFI